MPNPRFDTRVLHRLRVIRADLTGKSNDLVSLAASGIDGAFSVSLARLSPP